MDKQLTEVLTLLHQHQVAYWLDSGTLLGLKREGQLMAHDMDIDISVWGAEEAKIKKMIPLFRQAGYQIYSASYRGKVFKYTFTPNHAKARIIDIDLFQESQGHACCPMYYFNLNTKEKTEAKKNPVLGGIRSVVRTAWKKFNTKIPLHVKIDALPWRAFVHLGTWYIPTDYFTKIVYDHEVGAYIPKEWEKYLAFRYGNWQEPCEDWVFYRDDQGIQDIHPSQILS